MDGLLIVDKPAGLTSHDVVSRVRRILRTRRVGHTGTLDPFATGVMVLVVGQATRLAQFLDKDDKEYEALVQFGFQTETGDRTGSPIADSGLRIEDTEDLIANTDWQNVFSKFRGEILQTPPMYSAKKVGGKKLYELAREGVEIERRPVRVVIHKLELIEDGIRPHARIAPEEGLPLPGEMPTSAIRIRVICSAGTYIRTLAEAIGREIGIGAHLAELRRTRSGRFAIQDAVELSELEIMDNPADRLLPLAEAVGHLPAVTLSVERLQKTRNGLETYIDDETFEDGSMIRMLGPDLRLIAMGIYQAEQKSIRPKIVLV